MSKPEKLARSFAMTRKQFIQSMGGAVIYALGVNLFIIPCGVYNGGVLGISQLIYALVRALVPGFTMQGFTSIVYYVLNIPVFVLAFRKLGINFFSRTLLCVTVETVCLALIPIPKEMLVDSVLASDIIGAIVVGFGSGLIFLSRSSSGGTDVIGMYLSVKYRDFTVGRLSLSVNVVIYAICALCFNVSVAIYSIIYSAVASIVIDKVHAQNICTEMTIFTKKEPGAVLSYITRDLGRSGTYWEGTSGYRKERSYVICTVVSKYEVPQLEFFLKNYDADAFAVKKHGIAVDGNFIKKL